MIPDHFAFSGAAKVIKMSKLLANGILKIGVGLFILKNRDIERF